jgi:hypothetical protein
MITTGTFIIWLVGGFKTSFNDQMVSIEERHSKKGNVRFILGFIFWIVALIIVNIIFFRPVATAHYKVKTNEKGEIIELGEQL